MEKRHAQTVFQRADLPADRRLRQVERFTGMGEAASFRHGMKYP
jgi:hypothetical protein